MSWLQRLKEIEKGPTGALTKLTEGAFVSFVSPPGRHFQKIAPAESDQRARLERLAAEAGLSGDLVQRLPADEIEACALYSDRLLTVYLRALDRRIGAGPFHPTRRSTPR